jgi:hypothetical protein
MKKIKLLFIALIYISTTLSAFAQWSVISSVDTMTDEKKLSATTKNEAGYRMQIYRIKNNGPVWINFETPANTTDMFASKPLMYRVDKNKPYTVDLTNSLAKYGIVNSEWNPKWVNFLVWHGKESSSSSPILSELMQGNKLVFRYGVATGGFKDVEFDLVGAEDAIKNAINISGPASAEQLESEKEVKRLVSEHIVSCARKKSGSSDCSNKISSCAQTYKDNIEKYKLCVSNE